MALQNYKLADCNLFRKPPVDVSTVKSRIEDMLLDAWSAKGNPQEVVSRILNDNSILESLKKQVSGNLGFQRVYGEDKIDEGKDRNLGEHTDVYNAQVKTIESEVDEEEKEREERKREAQDEYDEVNSTHSVAEADLKAMRARVRRNIKNLGGGRSVDTLVEIGTGKPLSRKTERRSFLEEKEEIY